MAWNPNETTILGAGGDFDPAALWASYNQSRQKPQAPKKKQKDFWLDQISTVGGIIGGIGGSFVAPIAGTAVGAGAGSALGETLENILTGDDLGKNVLQEGALGAVFGAGPLKLLRAGGKTVGGMLGKGGANAASSVTGDVATQAVQAPMKTSFAGKANNLGNKLLQSQYGTISKPVARANQPANTVSKLADYGITKPKDAEAVASGITGSNGLLTQAVAGAIGDANPIKTTGIKTILNNAIVQNGLVDSEAKAIRNIVNAQMKSLNKSGGTASSTLDTIRSIEKRIANLEGKGSNNRLTTPERMDQANVLRAVKDELQERLFTTTGADKNVAGVLTPDFRQSLLNLRPNSAEWQKFVDDGVMKSGSIKDLRSAQAPFVRIGNIIREGEDNAFTFGGRVANSPFQAGTLTNAMAQMATNSLKNPTARLVSKPLRAIGNQTTSAPVKNSMKGIAGRLGAYGALTNTGEPVQPASLEDALSQSIGPNSEYANMANTESPNSPASMSSSSNMGSLYQNQSEMSSPYGRENLLYDIQRDPANADQYIAYYQQLQEVFAPSQVSTKPLSQGQQERADLIKALGLAENSVNNGSINYGPFGSTIENIKGMFNAADPETLSFRNIVSGLQAAITKARAGTSLTDGEKALLMQYTPNVSDSEQVVKSKLQALRQLYGYEMPVGGGSLEDALMMQGMGAGGY